ncbi:hypothetical protein HMPREF0179_03459 [Bilophila wadsworthia 3_1_6]|jgi:hypothetical protein|uniref:Uncharacterized protein n=1 Tax=Bilophila wadsworthia (strain 3_1_6) TaxID=563192 RepID=E5YB86_BILW3|nr:hypothetical protein [Bilophila wadsworthia]EFV42782.1 hypothetical protein HMPREF0179_03459 [Bilophila wadsworthia 3_1_6]DAV68587.1 MAG TPA: hypothetical protein [Bacteriophage sp.]
MATVTKEQRTYAVSRIREAGMKKVGIYKERSCLLREERKLTDADKRELVYAGVVPLRPDLSTYDIRNCFDFSAFENKTEYDEEKLRAFSEKTEKEIAKAIDAIMLGDAADIMKVIADFEKKMNGNNK